MSHWMNFCGAAVGSTFAFIASSQAADPIVQVIDGWKIVIQPGESAIPDPIPLSPQIALGEGPRPESLVQASSKQAGVPPAPASVVPPAPASAAPDAPKPEADGLPVITPGDFSQCCDPTPAVAPPEGTVDYRYLPAMYRDIYKSIPFVRAEYNANPSYIHDTAVEFLFGKMRPTVVLRGTVNVNVRSPYSYGSPFAGYGYPVGYGGYGLGGYPNGFAYPPMQLVVPGTGLRIHRLN